MITRKKKIIQDPVTAERGRGPGFEPMFATT